MANKVFLIQGPPTAGAKILVEAVSEKEATKLWANSVATVTKLSPSEVLKYASLPQLGETKPADDAGDSSAD